MVQHLPQSRAAAQVSVGIRRPDDDRILVLRDGTLPAMDVPVAEPWQVVGSVVEGLRDGPGLDTTVLRAAWLSDTRDVRLYEAAWLGGLVPSGAVWVSRDDLPRRLRTAPPGVTAAIAAGALLPATGDLQPWYVPGWLDGMTAWIGERLTDVGLRRHGPIRQVRSWGRSALLTFETDRGPVWVKEVPARFAHEIAVTGLLADLDPGLVPPLIAADAAARRLLMAHVDGPLLADEANDAAWTATLARLAETQRVLGVERGRLSTAGVEGASLSALAAEVPALIADRDLLRVGRPGGLSEGTVASLRDSGGAIAQACVALASTGIPESLDHGDLSATQVIVGAMGPVLFDWSDASITHPFLSLASFLDAASPDRRPAGDGLVRAYLGPWTDLVDAATGAEMVRLARMVLPVHLARLYRDRVLPGLEQPWEMEHVVPTMVGRWLASQAAAGVAR